MECLEKDQMRGPKSHWNSRRLLVICALSFGGAIAILLAASQTGLLPWSRFNCWTYDVDIQSGRVRYTRYLLWLPVRRSVQDSALTQALTPTDFSQENPRWRKAMTLSPGVEHSPHYIFHSAINQIHKLELAWALADFTTGAKRLSAQNVLKLWQKSGNDSSADQYLDALANLGLDPQGSAKRRVSEEDLPAAGVK